MSLALLRDLRPEQARLVSELLDEALSVPEAERARWQSELERREPEYSALIVKLLSAIAESTTVHPVDSVARVVSNAARQDGLARGQQLGPYRLVRLLGQGGMGSVWLAERADGLFKQNVALKLPHRNLVDTPARERFARERDILARLNHPWIARLLDAGFSPDGHPFLALEFVEGETLNVHCDQRRLGLRARLELMLQVLSAVQYAHQNLVIHRDLKPGNILVTEHGQVRLLDFGISKLMAEGEAAPQDSELTVLAGRALTPDYAAPEQVAGQPVTTASDVYSLGVVLYALLCGRRPFTTRNGQRIYAAHSGPLRPSEQVLDDAIALARGTSPKRLSRALSGDLDTIVHKALKEDPAERYPTAEAFRDDIVRYLAGDPVKARPDSVAYRAVKFVKRQRIAVSVSVLVAALLLGATQFSLEQARSARAAAALATQQAERARAVQDLLLGVFMSNSDQQLDPIAARQRTAQELLDIGSRRIVEQLSHTPEVLAGLCQTLADMYHQMGLGADAARMRAQAVSALQRVHGANHELVAETLLLKSQDERQVGLLLPALATLGEAERMLDRLGDKGSQTRAFVWLEAAQLEQYTRLDDMRRHAARARAYFKDHTVERMWSNRFHSIDIEARAYHFTGELELAETAHMDALRELERLGLQGSAWSITPLVWLAETDWQASQFESAEANLREALALALVYHGVDNASTLQTQTKLGALLHQTGRRDEGLRLLRDVESKLGASSGTNAIAAFRSFYGGALLLEGRVQEAAALFDELVAELQSRLPESLLMARALLLRASARRMAGQLKESGEDSASALQLWTAGAGAVARKSTVTPYYLERARIAIASGELDAAVASLDAISLDDDAAADAVETLIVRSEVDLKRGQGALASVHAQEALGLLRAPRLYGRLPQLEAEALLRSGEARVSAGERDAGCLDLAHAFQLRALSPLRAQIEAAVVGCGG